MFGLDRIRFTPAAALDRPLASATRDAAIEGALERRTSLPAVKIALKDDKAVLQWLADASRVYEVLYKDTLSESEWRPLPVQIQVVNGFGEAQDVIRQGHHRFYIVVEK